MNGAELRSRLDAARLYLCTDAAAGERATLDLVRAALDGGVDVVQLRDKTLSTREELALLDSVRELCIEAGALFAVNDRADVARIAGAQVFHTGQDDLPIEAARSLLGDEVLLGRSTHSAEQAARAAQDPEIDYFCVGPVWETPTKPGRPAAGLDTLREVALSEPATPWFAIGGIDLERLPQVLDAAARRIVVVRVITQADDPTAAARTLRTALP